MAFVASALSLFSGGVVGHALSVSTTTLGSSVNPSVWGQSVIFTATITPVSPAPTGTVTFQDGGTNIAGCVNRTVTARVATCATAALTVGSHTVTAVYGGNATYATSTSAPVVQVVDTGSTTAALVSSANPSVSGQTVTYTATVTAVAPAAGTRTGTVDFQDGGVDIAGCGAKAVAAAGTATCAIAYAGPGSHSITAIYSGDGNFTGSTSATLTQTVNLGATSTALTSRHQPVEHRRERDVHRQRDGDRSGVGHPYRHRRVPGRRRRHRRLQRRVRSRVGEGDVRDQRTAGRRDVDHRDLQR